MALPNYPLDRYHLKLGGRQLDLRAISPSAKLIDSSQPLDSAQDRASHLVRAQLWPASMMLAEYVLNDENGMNRHALEIACGLGLVSMGAALNDWRVVATDSSEECIHLAEDNAKYNGIKFDRLECLDWMTVSMNQQYERIFAVDLIHHRQHHKPLIDLLKRSLAVAGQALLSDPNRAASDAFFMLCHQEQLTVNIINAKTTMPDGSLVAGRICQIKKILP